MYDPTIEVEASDLENYNSNDVKEVFGD